MLSTSSIFIARKFFAEYYFYQPNKYKDKEVNK
jgi:hypothetical protein